MDTPDAFSRLDESDDAEFYSKDRFVSHLDSLARSTVEKLIETLVVEERPAILDLMAGWDSHLPAAVRASEVAGLGLNQNELRSNKALTRAVIHDLNREPRLPFPENHFDVVLNTVSVDYLTRPVDVFKEVARVLKPGGLFLVVFSNRMFPEKAVRAWREATEEERVLLVEAFFREAGAFEEPAVFISRGKPRPQDDKYAPLGIPSDPVYAVYADKKGGDPRRRKRPEPIVSCAEAPDGEEFERRRQAIKQTLCCPHCGEKMRKWAVPENPFEATWPNEFMYICFNDNCPYYVEGWDFMCREGRGGVSYRLMYDPEKDQCLPVPVPSSAALRESIVD